ncbi:class II aldolase/adducin family protein [Sphingomonas alba]|uniref:Class II aldolase/adducin family protein n=1 Tax=Sphingomonas alba TaxID=2908208 RepID=A0ABT0RKK5_9SPHN|nr:class II aldolase/adducin family protein [Sphingomonas alba]MCL6683181.1 class II aldolase/adducin family protein [Sphingomonas alba]
MLPSRLMMVLGALLLLAAAPAPAQSLPGVAAAATRLGVDPRVIEDLVVANRILAHEGVLDAYGHVSIRHPTRPNHYLIARSVAAEFVTPDDIVEFDLDSNLVTPGESKEFIERFIHGEIYKARPDLDAVIHSHSASVIPFSVSTVPLRPVFHMAAFLASGVPVWDSGSAGDPDAQGILVRNPALGASLATTLGKGVAVLLRGHGAVVVSRELRVAVRNAIWLEANARAQLAAIQLGGQIKYISADEARAMLALRGDPERAWDYWKRRALGPK